MSKVNNTEAMLKQIIEMLVKQNEEIAKLKENKITTQHTLGNISGVSNKPLPIRNLVEKIKEVDLKKLNNILRASDMSTMTDVEIDYYSGYTFNTEKSYFDTIYELINIRKEPKDAMKRFRDYAEERGFIYKNKSDIPLIMGGSNR